ncbi:hypothetical protein RhiLY_08456 [Ceratobasidium sp. AG-Ba]|nr:hypothetical protein RhiLY_08456 [Ceratobasidium sp. AG-Ba]
MSAAHYLHTAEAHAGTMLGTVKQLAAGMGATERGKESDEGKRNVGNAHWGYGLGCASLRGGEVEQAKKQDAKNKKLWKAVAEIGAAE